MATKAATALTYRNIVQGLKGDGSFDGEIVDIVAQENAILDDMIVVEANDGTSNKTTIRTGLPDSAWRAFYEGVQASNGSKKQIRNTAGQIASKLEIDKKLWDIAPNQNALLLDEIQAHAEAMGQDMATALFYGKITTEPKAFNGLINFYGSLGGASSTDDTVATHYVFDAKSTTQASTAALRSIWLLGWGQKSIRAFYPQGSKTGGIDRGEFRLTDLHDAADSTKTFEGYCQYLYWTLGLDVRDYRYGGRIANLQADEMFDTTGVPDYAELLTRLETRVRSTGVNQVWYMDKLSWEAVRIWLARKTMSNAITTEQVFQRPTKMLFGIPVRICDALNTNETEVTA